MRVANAVQFALESLPFLTVSKSVTRASIPHLYRHVELSGAKQCSAFRCAIPASMQRIKTRTFLPCRGTDGLMCVG